MASSKVEVKEKRREERAFASALGSLKVVLKKVGTRASRGRTTSRASGGGGEEEEELGERRESMMEWK